MGNVVESILNDWYGAMYKMYLFAGSQILQDQASEQACQAAEDLLMAAGYLHALGHIDTLVPRWRRFASGKVAVVAATTLASNLEYFAPEVLNIIKKPIAQQTFLTPLARIKYILSNLKFYLTEEAVVLLRLNFWATAWAIRQVQGVESKILAQLEKAEAAVDAAFADQIISIWLAEHIEAKRREPLVQAIITAGIAKLPPMFL